MKLSLDPMQSDYLGSSYLHEYKEAGFAKSTPLEKALLQREKLKKGELIRIPYGNSRFESFVLEKANDIDFSMAPSISYSKYNIVAQKIMKPSNRLISSEDLNVIKSIIADYQKDLDEAERECEKKCKRQKKEYLPNKIDLETYLYDCALMVVYMKNECFESKEEYSNKLNEVVDKKQRQEVCNFYSLLDPIGLNRFPKLKAKIRRMFNHTSNPNLNVDSINVKYSIGGLNKSLKINNPLLMRMMLNEFAKKYYPIIENTDPDHWENEVIYFAEEPHGGVPKSPDARIYGALIHAYLGFVGSEGLYKPVRGKKDVRYILLGRLHLMFGVPKYVEDVSAKDDFEGYNNEGAYYKKRLTRRL